MNRKSPAATKMARTLAVALVILLCRSVYATPAADVDSAVVRATGTQPSAYLREARVGDFLSAQRTVGLASRFRPAGAAPGFSTPVDVSPSGLLPRLDCVFGSDLQLSSRNDSEVLLRNSDALVRAKLRLTLGKEWLFVYGDMGPWGSTLRWQGLVGIRVGHGANLVGGWRHVTYYLSPGRDFNSLDSEGPFLGAQRAW